MSKKSTPENAFNTLPVSTQTVMVYLNCTFDINNIFNNIMVTQTDTKDIKKVKGEHGKIYQIKRDGQVRGAPTKKRHFGNQITVYIHVVDKMVTAKIFRTGKFHLTGCKRLEHQQHAVIELVRHIRTINTPEAPTITMEDNNPLTATLEVVMVNIDFHLGFDVDQRKLDRLLQNETNDFYTIFETPVNTSINIKLDYDDPEEKVFHQVVITGSPKKQTVKFTTTDECPKAKSKDTRTHTFLVFSSSKVIQSGRYYDDQMEPAYRKFRDFITKNRNKIELELKDKKFDMKSLKGISSEPLRIKIPANHV